MLYFSFEDHVKCICLKGIVHLKINVVIIYSPFIPKKNVDHMTTVYMTFYEAIQCLYFEHGTSVNFAPRVSCQ